MTQPTSKFLKGFRSLATQDDRDWFRAHPTKTWRLRKALDKEEETLLRDPLHSEPTLYALMKAHLIARAQHPDAAPVTELVVCVLAIEPGTRARVPALRDARSGKFWLVDEEGTVVSPETLVARFRAGLAAGGLVERELGNGCSGCGRPERTGDLSVVFEGASGPETPEVLCLGCAVPRLRGGRAAQALSLCVEEGAEPKGPVMSAAVTALQRLKAAESSPSALADAIVALLRERSRR